VDEEDVARQEDNQSDEGLRPQECRIFWLTGYTQGNKNSVPYCLISQDIVDFRVSKAYLSAYSRSYPMR
jgi:hypothetical protein